MKAKTEAIDPSPSIADGPPQDLPPYPDAFIERLNLSVLPYWEREFIRRTDAPAEYLRKAFAYTFAEIGTVDFEAVQQWARGYGFGVTSFGDMGEKVHTYTFSFPLKSTAVDHTNRASIALLLGRPGMAHEELKWASLRAKQEIKDAAEKARSVGTEG